MDHLLNLRGLAKTACPPSSNEITFYNHTMAMFQGAYGQVTDDELRAIKKALAKDHAAVMAHIKGIEAQRKKSAAKNKKLMK